MNKEELIEECKKHGLVVTSPEVKKKEYTPIVRYDRGLGPEYILLGFIAGDTIAACKKEAERQIEELFALDEQYKNAKLIEIRFRCLNTGFLCS